MNSCRVVTDPTACTFFKPIHLHGQLANLLVQLGHQRLAVLIGRSRGLEQLRQVVSDHTLPLGHLHRMHLVVSGNLPDRLDAHQGFQSHLGLEGAWVSFPFDSAHSPTGFACPAEPQKSNLLRLA